MTRVPLTFAISEYDHVTDLVTGRVPVEGVELTCLNLQIEEIFFRQFVYRDFDVSEVSMAKYCSMVSQGDIAAGGDPGISFAGAPAFIDLYPPRRAGERPADLAGKQASACRNGRRPRRCIRAACWRISTASTSPRLNGCRPASTSPGGWKRSS